MGIRRVATSCCCVEPLIDSDIDLDGDDDWCWRCRLPIPELAFG